MKKFIYRGYNKDKKLIRGIIEADSHRDALVNLKKEKGLVLTSSLKEKRVLPPKVAKAYDEMADKNRQTIVLIQNNVSRLGAKVGNFTNGIMQRSMKNKVAKDSEIMNMLAKLEHTLRTGGQATVSADGTAEGGTSTLRIFVDSSAEGGGGGKTLAGTLSGGTLDRKEASGGPTFKRKDLRKNIMEYDLTSEKFRRDPKEIKKVKVPERDIMFFTRQLSLLLASGVSLPKSLSTLYTTAKRKGFRMLISSLHSEVMEGNSLSYAMSRFPSQFNDLYLALVTIGETSGTLPRVLRDLVTFMERKQKVRASVKTAMIYPSIVLGLIACLMIAGSIFFIPMFEELFHDVGLELPGMTRAMFAMAGVMHYLLGTAALFFIVMRLLPRISSPWVQRVLIRRDLIMLRLPGVKDLVVSLSMFYFSHSLSLMLQNGIRLPDSMGMSAAVIGNRRIKAELQDAQDLVLEGANVSESLACQKHVSDLVVSMVNTGEESGRLEQVLEQVSEHYSDMLQQSITNLAQWAQPAAVLMVAAIAVPFVFAVFFPLLDIMSGSFISEM